MSDFLPPSEADVPAPQDPQEKLSIEIGWECMKSLSMPEVYLWLGDHDWAGAWHVTAALHPQGYLLRSHRHTVAVLSSPTSMN